MSTRKRDTRGERALGLFLDTYFYPELIKNRVIDNFERNYEVLKQKKGLDILVYANGEPINIDEKSQLYYINNPKPSFVVEVDFISLNTHSVEDGWFLSRSSITDTYLFAWINSATTNLLHRIVSEDFEEVEVALVKKTGIQSHLQKAGFTEQRIRKEAKRIRDRRVRAREVKSNDFHFSFTENREEQPINIVLEKKLIDSLAEYRYIVKKDGIRSMKESM